MTTPFDDPQAELAWMFLQCICEGGDLDEGFALLSDDFSYWTITTRKTVDKATLRRIVERSRRDADISLDLIRCVNEGESVVIEAEADGMTSTGVRYDSPFVFIFETADGLITSLREYSDTRLAEQAFAIRPQP